MPANETQNVPSSETLRATPHEGTQEVRLGVEIDQCSGSLTVKDRTGKFVRITRGKKTTVDVAITGDGYWFWKCGSSLERSRGEPNYRQRVKRLKVTHSRENREIRWECFDLL